MTRCAQLDSLASATAARITCLLNAINRRVGKASTASGEVFVSWGVLPRLRAEVRPFLYVSPRAALQITVEARIP